MRRGESTVARPASLTLVGTSAAPRELTSTHISGIRTVMQLFIDDDLVNGVSSDRRMFCDACQKAQPAPGFLQYERYAVCNRCATEYEVAKARGLVCSIGQFARDKAFGEAERYELPWAVA